jgi:hypothetical protein
MAKSKLVLLEPHIRALSAHYDDDIVITFYYDPTKDPNLTQPFLSMIETKEEFSKRNILSIPPPYEH